MSTLEVASLTLFRDLSEAEHQRLCAESYCASFPTGMTLFWQNTPVNYLHVVITGHVCLITYRNGHEHNVLMPGGGCAFPLGSLVGEGSALTTARTATPCRIATVPIEIVRSLIQENPAFVRAALRQSLRLAKILIEESHLRSLCKPYERIAFWIRQNMNFSADGQSAPLPYPKLTLAAALGMSASTFARETERLVAHGIIFRRDSVQVANLAILEQLADGRVEVLI
jgi:CRP-like cAMP-binding protein